MLEQAGESHHLKTTTSSGLDCSGRSKCAMEKMLARSQRPKPSVLASCRRQLSHSASTLIKRTEMKDLMKAKASG